MNNIILAQALNEDPQIKGQWFSPTQLDSVNFIWRAHWIWLDEKEDYDVLLTRRQFELTALPDHAQLGITASSQYQLYINGEYICRGPARSAPHHQSFDLIDVKTHLKLGQNLIAVRVHHQDNKYAYHLRGRAGLLAQLELDTEGTRDVIISDQNWKVSPDLSWNKEAPIISRFQMVVNDRIDLRQKARGWNQIKFDDEGWETASPLIRNVGWPAPQKNAEPQTLTPPWTQLIPRDIPYLMQHTIKVTSLIEARSIEEDYLGPYLTHQHKVTSGISINGSIDANIEYQLKSFKAGKSIKIKAVDSLHPYMVLFDLNSIRNGCTRLDLEGPKGAKVDILYAPYLLDDRFCHNLLDSDFRDQLILSGQRDQWESTYFKPTRYLAIIFPPSDEVFTIHQVKMLYFQYPFESSGTMYSTDAGWVAQYMDASAKTIDVCTTDGYTDNYRERRQYAQTGYYAALGNNWLFGDHSLQRRYLVQTAQEQEPNGIMPAYAPLAKDDYMVILDSNCLWIRSLRNYLLFTGDTYTTRGLMPYALRLMKLLHNYTNELGMIENPPYPYWLDHSENDRRGANLNLNGHYLGALEDFAEVLEWLNEENSIDYHSRARLLRTSLQKYLWDEERQLFADALIDDQRSKHFSEHANAMALAENIATDKQAAAISDQLLVQDKHDYIKRVSGVTMVTPAMSYFLHKGLCEAGFVDESFRLFRERFDKMLEPQHNGTLWEEWWLKGTGRSGTFNSIKSRSDAQTESAFPPALFGEYLLGVQPTQPGFREVEIKRSISSLQHIEGNIPTPHGLLFVKWDLKNRLLNLEIPGAITAKVDVNSLGVPVEMIKVNGKSVQPSTPAIHLSKGNHLISF